MVSFGTPSREMLAQAVINVLCEEHGIENPPMLKINGRLGRALGRANKTANTIEINPLIVDTFQLEETIRHEVAHFKAFMFGDNAHGEIWKRCAVECGANPHPIAPLNPENPKANGKRWQAGCSQGCNFYHIRKPRRVFMQDGIEFLGYSPLSKFICRKHGLPFVLKKL